MVNLEDFRVPGSEDAYYIPGFLSEDEEKYLIRKIYELPKQKWKNLANRRFVLEALAQIHTSYILDSHRLQLLGGDLSPKNYLFPEDMPQFVNKYPDIVTRLQDTEAFKSSPHRCPNHIILNEYLPGQGIMPHEDGPAYHPVVATISVGSHVVFHYHRYKDDNDAALSESATSSGKSIEPTPVLTVLLEPRSVIITMSSLYTAHAHGIQAVKEDIVSASTSGGPPLLANLNVPIANWRMIQGERERRILLEGGVLKRSTRYSLTCRDVPKVSTHTRLLGRR